MKNKVWCATRWLDPLAFKGHLHVYWDSVPHDKVLEFSRAEECNQPQHIQSVEAKLRTTWTFVRTPDKFKAWSQVQEVFLALQESFLEILDHPWHFKQKNDLASFVFRQWKEHGFLLLTCWEKTSQYKPSTRYKLKVLATGMPKLRHLPSFFMLKPSAVLIQIFSHRRQGVLSANCDMVLSSNDGYTCGVIYLFFCFSSLK